MSDSDSPVSASLPQITAFSDEHIKYLDELLPKYHAFEVLVAQDKLKKEHLREYKKGSKKNWINNNVCPKFIQKFELEGKYNLAGVRAKVARFFFNHKNPKARKIVARPAGSKPAAKSAVQIFNESNKTAISSLAAELAKKGQKDGDSGSDQDEEESDDEGKEKGGQGREEAGELGILEVGQRRPLCGAERRREEETRGAGNRAQRAIREGNQSAITDIVGTAVDKTIGHRWGGLGDVAVFVAGVFRTEAGALQTFSLSCQEKEDAPAFKTRVPDFPAFRKKLIEWGGEVLPKVEGDRLTLTYDDGFPRLPPLTDETPPNVARALLLLFAQKIYEYSGTVPPESEKDLRIQMHLDNQSVGVTQEEEIFCPSTMTSEEVYTLYNRLVEDQTRVPRHFIFVNPGKGKGKGKGKAGKGKVQTEVSDAPVDYSIKPRGATTSTPVAPASPTSLTPGSPVAPPSRSPSPSASVQGDAESGGKRKGEDVLEDEGPPAKKGPAVKKAVKKGKGTTVGTAELRKRLGLFAHFPMARYRRTHTRYPNGSLTGNGRSRGRVAAGSPKTDVLLSILGRAKASGFTALVVTLGAMLLSCRPHDLANSYIPFAHGVGVQKRLGREPLLKTRTAFRYDSCELDRRAAAGDAEARDGVFLGTEWLKECNPGLFHMRAALSACALGGASRARRTQRRRCSTVSTGIMRSEKVKAAQAAGALTVPFDSGVRTGPTSSRRAGRPPCALIDVDIPLRARTIHLTIDMPRSGPPMAVRRHRLEAGGYRAGLARHPRGPRRDARPLGLCEPCGDTGNV
ncbi:hypothetical protein DFH07DRAFT_774227 [Mycena maculata]|uniref:Uncharacterized protein n=1 Tax=Mycena maculata TaxID=230809 RepID=A0AAD7IYB0_9AGAR|nr:hypothetical protein DFH07DRAFT_774227 [Mycena maculata]